MVLILLVKFHFQIKPDGIAGFEWYFMQKNHIQYWADFFEHEYEESRNETVKAIRATLQNLQDIGDIQRKDIRRYSAVTELENPSDSLLHEWAIYCGLEFNEDLSETDLDDYLKKKSVRLPILSNIALDYIWLPNSSCAVERSFSLYNTLLDSNRQSLSKDSLKQLNMYFN
ncbi:hypothetical protein RclHR1_01020033 [Rhizophagus clarus]|uniref:HAT C-terminal dimerisation domain-containing protein n=1 Tax=Rhizophagus clarus TaxID=94130 RepID=A0A2Z6Q5J4_9GLOM|nr:hypothetical protein RclHR1_01020033 [Rhizophagus clarus]GES76528.1 hypothetical protein GLOIN_2v1761741 [Rhizophagus clarus]